ncbi:MAG: DUF2249 domain-containing protein [Thermoleophilia bacterium]
MAADAVVTPFPPGTRVVRIALPASAALPAHDHGDRDLTLVALAGAARVSWDGDEAELSPGVSVAIPGDRRVSVTNPGSGEARLLAVLVPAGDRVQACGPAPGDGDLSSEALLDLTGLPRPQRHRLVIAALEALDAGSRLVIVNDHEPVGLRRQLERRYAERLGWEGRESAEARAVVAIWLTDPPAGDGVAAGPAAAGAAAR